MAKPIQEVFLVVEGTFPPPARANLRLYRLGLALLGRGVQVNLLSPGEVPFSSESYLYEGIRVRRFPGLARLQYSRVRILIRAFQVVTATLYLTHLCRRNTASASVIHCWNLVAGLAGIVAGMLTHTPVYVDFTDLYSDIARYESPIVQRVLFRLESTVARKATRIFAVTEQMKNVLISLGVRAERIEVVPDGTDEKLFDPSLKGLEVREKLGLGKSPVLIFHGDIQYADGVDVLLSAFQKALKRFPSAKLLIVGGGSGLQPVRKTVASLQLSKSVIFTGWIPHREVPKYIAASDVGVMPLRSTLQTNCYLSFKLFEYWSMKKPVIVSRVDSIASVAREGESAILVEPGNVQSLTDAIVKALGNPHAVKFLGENGRKLVETTYNWTKLMRNESFAYVE